MTTQETFQAVQNLYIGLFTAFTLLAVIRQPGLFPDDDVIEALDQKLQEQFDHLGAVQFALEIDSVFPDMTQDEIDQLALDCLKSLDLEKLEVAA